MGNRMSFCATPAKKILEHLPKLNLFDKTSMLFNVLRAFPRDFANDFCIWCCLQSLKIVQLQGTLHLDLANPNCGSHL